MIAKPLRVAFAGTPDFAATHLQALINSPHPLIAAYTQPDRPAGRGKQLKASPVKELARTQNIPIYQPQSLKSVQEQQALAALQPDLLVVVAYGLLLPPAVLAIPRLGCINVHASILPRWRGAAPIQRAIEAGDTESGITIMQMEAGLDTGPTLNTVRCPIDKCETAASLHDKLAMLGQPALIQVIDDLSQNASSAKAQDNTLATYAKKIDKQEAQINWQEPITLIERKIRAYNPFPGSFTYLGQSRVKILQADAFDTLDHASQPGTIHSAKTSGLEVNGVDGTLVIKALQMPGKKAMDIASVVNGNANMFQPGQCFG